MPYLCEKQVEQIIALLPGGGFLGGRFPVAVDEGGGDVGVLEKLQRLGQVLRRLRHEPPDILVVDVFLAAADAGEEEHQEQKGRHLGAAGTRSVFGFTGATGCRPFGSR